MVTLGRMGEDVLVQFVWLALGIALGLYFVFSVVVGPRQNPQKPERDRVVSRD
jgi:hypothetical protein